MSSAVGSRLREGTHGPILLPGEGASKAASDPVVTVPTAYACRGRYLAVRAVVVAANVISAVLPLGVFERRGDPS